MCVWSTVHWEGGGDEVCRVVTYVTKGEKYKLNSLLCIDVLNNFLRGRGEGEI
jgi:hypothetical protein